MANIEASDGTIIEFEVHGSDAVASGPPVILVHGITESSITWAPVTERLATHHQLITMDLRGHGRSATAERYDLEAMAGDVIAVAMATGVQHPHLVGHSLGGAVVSAVGAAMPVTSIVNVDQSLQLGGFKEQLMPFADQLRDADAFPAIIEALFGLLAGDAIAPTELERVNAARRPDQKVVLGVWDLILNSNLAEIADAVDAALAGYRGTTTPYLSLFGVDPGEAYGDWLASRISGAITEVWPDHGHYPHLVDPDRFVTRLDAFWAGLAAGH